jgi:8-amino-7-oxononanoate synthase
MAFDFITEQVAKQQSLSRYRQRVCIKTSVTKTTSADVLTEPYIEVADKKYLNFSSNDYLGLNHHPKINQAMQDGVDKFGVSACSSSLVTGFHYAHQALEDVICQWLNKPRCLLFSSGFTANMAVFQALGQDKSINFYLDKLSHASMLDGAYASKANVKRFLHNDLAHLTQLMTKNLTGNSVSDSIKNSLIASEGVFSMDGDQAKLPELEQIAKTQNAWLYLDDAHSIGVIGEKGQGSASKVSTDITMATFGKAIATSGAFVACDEPLHDYLINFARHYIYSTAISPAMAWATKRSIELIQEEQWRRDKIAELTQLLTELLDANIEIISSQSSIQAIIIGDENKTLQVSDILRKQGFWITAIRPPTVANGSSRLRITICANHNHNQIRQLANCLNSALN